MADWKIALVVLFGLLLITLGLFTEMGLNIGGFGKEISDALGKIFPLDFMETPEEGNITVSGTFYLKEIDLKTLPLEEVKVGYEPAFQDTDIFLSETKLTTGSQTQIELKGYEGTFLLNGSRITIVGDAEETEVNGIRFETVKKLIPVNLGSVIFKNVFVKKLYMNRLEMEDVSGEIYVQDKVTLRMEKEPLKLECFSGSLNLTESQFQIDGTAKRVFVSGEDFTATVS